MPINYSTDYNIGDVLSLEIDGQQTFGVWGGSGVRTGEKNFVQLDDARVQNVKRVPVIQNIPMLLVKVTEEIGRISTTGLSDEDRRVIGQALSKIIGDLIPLPPEPPQWTTVKVTYNDPGPSPAHGWDYYVRDGADLGDSHPVVQRWMGPGKRASWAEMQAMGSVEIMPTPARDEDVF